MGIQGPPVEEVAYPSQLWPKPSWGTGPGSHESVGEPRIPLNPTLWFGDTSPALPSVFAISDQNGPKGSPGCLLPTLLPTILSSFKRDGAGQRMM